MILRAPLICALCLCALSPGYAFLVPDIHHRFKRQEPEGDSEDYVADYAGNENQEVPKPEPKDTFRDSFTDTQNNDINEDKFGEDTFDDPPREEDNVKEESRAEKSEEVKPKKKVKKHKYLKKTLEFLKRVLDPNKLMQNAYINEMLRRFSHNEEPEYVDRESTEEELKEVHTPKPARRRRGRPKKDKIPPGITGIIKKGVMTLTRLELDKRKLRRRVKMIKKFARKAKKPLKTAVKIFLSSRNQGVGGYGGDGYGNNNY